MTLALIDPTSSYRVHKTCYSSFAKLPHATSQVKRLQESLSPSALVINNDNKKCTPATSCPDFPSARVTLLLGSAPLKSTQNWKMQVFSLLLSLPSLSELSTGGYSSCRMLLLRPSTGATAAAEHSLRARSRWPSCRSLQSMLGARVSSS